jgi:hypothetical protein
MAKSNSISMDTKQHRNTMTTWWASRLLRNLASRQMKCSRQSRLTQQYMCTSSRDIGERSCLEAKAKPLAPSINKYQV